MGEVDAGGQPSSPGFAGDRRHVVLSGNLAMGVPSSARDCVAARVRQESDGRVTTMLWPILGRPSTSTSSKR